MFNYDKSLVYFLKDTFFVVYLLLYETRVHTWSIIRYPLGSVARGLFFSDNFSVLFWESIVIETNFNFRAIFRYGQVYDRLVHCQLFRDVHRLLDRRRGMLEEIAWKHHGHGYSSAVSM